MSKGRSIRRPSVRGGLSVGPFSGVDLFFTAQNSSRYSDLFQELYSGLLELFKKDASKKIDIISFKFKAPIFCKSI